MATKKTIAVVGSTGGQGGGLVRAVMNDPNGEFAVRALTRNPKSDKAKRIADLGAEVVAADANDEASLKSAFDGCYGAYCVTAYWELFSPEKELAHASNLARAAKATGIQHAIWSTLEDTREFMKLSDDRMPTLMGKYKVPHFDGKGEADHVFAELGVPTTNLRTAFYWDNFIYFGVGPKPGPDGVLAITFPMGDKKLPGIAVEDIGRCAYGVFKQGKEFIGKTIGIAGENLTGAEMAAKMSKALGKEIRFNDVPPEVYRGFGFEGADDLGNMFQFKRDFNDAFVGARDIGLARRLNPALQNFDQWLAEHASSIPLE